MDRDPALSVRTATDLVAALGVGAGDMVSLVGGGGKTTAMYRLTETLSRTGIRAAAATTTKIAPPTEEDGAALLCVQGWEELRRSLADWPWTGRPPVIGMRRLPTAKVEGIPPEWCDRLIGEDVLDALIVEADGAARKAVKAPEHWEPVVPSATTVFVAVVGLSCFGASLSSEAVFRPERISAVTGCPLGAPLTAEVLAALLASEAGLLRGRSAGMRAAALLNQADLPEAKTAGRHIAAEIFRKTDVYERVLVASVQRTHEKVEIWDRGNCSGEENERATQ